MEAAAEGCLPAQPSCSGGPQAGSALSPTTVTLQHTAAARGKGWACLLQGPGADGVLRGPLGWPRAEQYLQRRPPSFPTRLGLAPFAEHSPYCPPTGQQSCTTLGHWLAPQAGCSTTRWHPQPIPPMLVAWPGGRWAAAEIASWGGGGAWPSMAVPSGIVPSGSKQRG